jgi:hypothetical protein
LEIRNRKIFCNDSLVRTIILTLENAIVNSNEGKAKALKNVRKGFVKMIKAIINNIILNI